MAAGHACAGCISDALSKSQAVTQHERGAVTVAVASTGGPPQEQLVPAETRPPDMVLLTCCHLLIETSPNSGKWIQNVTSVIHTETRPTPGGASIHSTQTPVKRLLCYKGLWFDSLWNVLEQAAEPHISPEAAHSASE